MAERDEQQFERLYRKHFDRVAAYLLSRADRGLAEEALARTFEVAWRRLGDVPEEPLPWLLGVARRVLADLRRAQGRRGALIERIAETTVEAGEDHAERLSARHRVLAALDALTEPQREVLLLVVWDGLSQREVAAALGCSRGAVALRLRRARARMSSALEQAASAEEAKAHAPTDSSYPRPHNPTTPPCIEEAT
jgi:RNA polymerase sigma-70 factor (ECF subfamily)